MNTAPRFPRFQINARHQLDACAGTPAVEHGLLTPNHGGRLLAPVLIVLHYTAGNSAEGSAHWLCSAQSKASAHLLVGRGGKVWQLLGLGTQAWHAGRSSWGKHTNLNTCSIGIELANLGFDNLTRVPAERLLHALHKHGGAFRAWERYAPPQVATAVALCAALQMRYPSLVEIVGHDDIAPGRKSDPGPAWDWKAFLAALNAYHRAEIAHA